MKLFTLTPLLIADFEGVTSLYSTILTQLHVVNEVLFIQRKGPRFIFILFQDLLCLQHQSNSPPIRNKDEIHCQISWPKAYKKGANKKWNVFRKNPKSSFCSCSSHLILSISACIHRKSCSPVSCGERVEKEMTETGDDRTVSVSTCRGVVGGVPIHKVWPLCCVTLNWTERSTP